MEAIRMKTLFVVLTIVLAVSSAHAQTQALAAPVLDLTNLEDFSSRSGTLIQREFTRVGEFSSPFRVDVVKVTDLMDKRSVQGVRISANVGAGSTRDSAFIDADEIDSLIRSIALMKSSAFSTTPDNFTDLAYRTRGGLALGALYANKRWNIYLRLDRFDPKSSVNIDQNDLETLRDLLTQAKERIK
jgi:hypothetical protein